jgi:hypothetical protein
MSVAGTETTTGLQERIEAATAALTGNPPQLEIHNVSVNVILNFNVVTPEGATDAEIHDATMRAIQLQRENLDRIASLLPRGFMLTDCGQGDERGQYITIVNTVPLRDARTVVVAGGEQ